MNNYTIKRNVILIPIIFNTAIFILLSMLHFYWVLGGRRWYNDVLPTTSNGLHRLNPGTASTIMVALGLLFLALTTAGNQGLFDRHIKRKYFRFGALIIALIFLLRAVGDFKMIGFFKTVKSTEFGINDTQIFSPLCVCISVLSLWIFLSARRKVTNI